MTQEDKELLIAIQNKGRREADIINTIDIIRVFPRRTKWTPTDGLAFLGGPPLFRLPDLPVMVSVAFTWDIPEARRLERLWRFAGFSTQIGGPAMGDAGGEFVPGQFLKEGVTITSRGCPKRCSFCLVHKREGVLREIDIKPGWIVQDNNLLAGSDDHIGEVFSMLKGQPKPVSFPGGLDIDYLRDWHVELFKSVRLDKSALWIACDSEKDLARLDKAADLLGDFPIDKKRCYVMVGYGGETQKQAAARCRAVLAKGFLPFAQLYRSPSSMQGRGEWMDFCHYWSSPKYYRKKEGLL